MEKHKCKLCLRKFANGRALGGHVRSHMMNLFPPPKPSKLLQEEDSEEEEIGSLPSSTSVTTSEEEDEEEHKGIFSSHDSRENLKKISHWMDHHFGSVVLQDRQNESESSRDLFKRQTKRIRSSRNSSGLTTHHFCIKDSIFRQPKFEKEVNKKSPVQSPPSIEAEPLTSISETTTEKDVAYCLMMLSRDKWIRTREESEEREKKGQTKHQFQESWVKGTKSSRSRCKYRCETCDKVFRSYQALGGHRASHKRRKSSNFSSTEEKGKGGGGNAGGSSLLVEEQKIHECPVCFKVFSSGQALGGHKRSHGAFSSLNLASNKQFFSSRSGGEALIDLNLPAPIDDEDDISQVEQYSAVSDDDFVHQMKH